MKTQEMLNAKQAYEHPWTESIRLHVESVICYSGGNGGSADASDENDG